MALHLLEDIQNKSITLYCSSNKNFIEICGFKTSKTRESFPHENSLLKLLYMGIQKTSKK
jgi:hypothetical protein